jgi:hydrogenase expression/formation protein HypE
MDDPQGREFEVACPTPLSNHETVQLAHGGGGRLMRRLIEELFVAAFGPTPSTDSSELKVPLNDSAVIDVGTAQLAFTTDSFVVDPLFFPGGDIGELAVYGTVNDLAMSGATPLFLSAGFVLEEGLPLDTLRRVVMSMKAAAAEAGVRIVTGDTKVVDRGKADRMFINTAGIGRVPQGVELCPRRVEIGDVVLVSGDLGRHGMAIMSVREGLNFETALKSDCASLASLAGELVTLGTDLHCLRDLTRGGLATALNEIAVDAQVAVRIAESKIPVSAPVAAACELLGLDPLYVANEGRLVAVVAGNAADKALAVLENHPASANPAIVGEVTAGRAGSVILESVLGGERILDLLSGEQMPRIC